MTAYYLYLGYRWDSNLIGAIWGAPSSEYRSLNYALSTTSGASVPAWFTFETNDTLNLTISDLSDLSHGVADSMSLSLSFAQLTQATTYDPDKFATSMTGFASKTSNEQHYLEADSIGISWDSQTRSYWSPWGDCHGQSSSALSFQFSSLLICEMSFALQVVRPPATRIFVGDPETRVTPGS